MHSTTAMRPSKARDALIFCLGVVLIGVLIAYIFKEVSGSIVIDLGDVKGTQRGHGAPPCFIHIDI